MSGFNVIGTVTLFKKECWRFLRVSVQTVLTPVITALLYMAVFAQVMSNRAAIYGSISYLQFLVAGLAMMTLLQNAYANSSSSLIQSKSNGNLIFLLLAPLSALEVFLGYVLAGVVRGILVGVCVFVVAMFFVDMYVSHVVLALAMLVMSAALLAALGVLAGIWAEQFDQMAIFQNFIIMPLSFLSGAFYSIHNLPPFWAQVSKFNPFFYMVDGFRYAVWGVSDIAPVYSFSFVLLALILVSGLTLWLLARGYKLRQ